MEQTIKLFSEASDLEKVIMSDLLSDIIYFDLNNKHTSPNTLEFKRFESKYKPKVIKLYYDLSIKESGEKNVKKVVKSFFENIYDIHFGLENMKSFPNVVTVPIYKQIKFSHTLEGFIKKGITNIHGIFATRKLCLKILEENNIIIKSHDNLEHGDIYNLIKSSESETGKKTMIGKLLNELIKDLNSTYGVELYKQGLQDIKGIEDKIGLYTFNKKNIQKLYDSISNNGNDLTYSIVENCFFYNGEELKPFKTQKNKINLRVELCKLMYSHEKGQEINFKEMLPFYIEDDYYSNTLTKPIINKIIKLIGKVNAIIKEKTQNSDIKLFSQETIDGEHYIIRNI